MSSNISNRDNSCSDEFKKIIRDFIGDIKTTFPEYAMIINKYFYGVARLEDKDTPISDDIYNKTFEFCKTKYSPRFFDILHQNSKIFEEGSHEDTEFIPNIYFKSLFSCDITEHTKKTIWKYLQLILFSVVDKLDDQNQFGESLKLFEAINNDDFKLKLEETFDGIKEMFEPKHDSTHKSENNTSSESDFNMENMADPEKMHEHINGLLNGKLGNLATEIAEEITGDLNIDPTKSENVNDLFSNMISNPTQLMGIMNKVTNKLENKIKSGDIKESELLSEASDMMNQMKNIPGMGNMQSLFSKMGMGMDMFGGEKVNTKATEEQLKRRMKLAKTKERIKAKAEANEKARQEEMLLKNLSALSNNSNNSNNSIENKKSEILTDKELEKIFDETVDETKTNKTKQVKQVKQKDKKKKKK